MASSGVPSLPGVALKLLLLVVLAAGAPTMFFVLSNGWHGIWTVVSGLAFLGLCALVTWLIYLFARRRLKDKEVPAGVWPSLTGVVAWIMLVLIAIFDVSVVAIVVCRFLNGPPNNALMRHLPPWHRYDFLTVCLTLGMLFVLVWLTLDFSNSLPARQKNKLSKSQETRRQYEESLQDH